MQTELFLQNIVCPASVDPTAFDVSEFATGLALGRAEDQVVLADVSLNEWERVRLQILPDRLQLGFKKDADSDLIRRAIEAFTLRKDELAPDEPLIFNAGLRLEMEDGEGDPSAGLVNAKDLATRLGAKSEGRGGVTLVFRDALSRWWIELSPAPDKERVWTHDFSRQFGEFPAPGDVRNEILAWFASIEGDLLVQFETISSGVDE